MLISVYVFRGAAAAESVIPVAERNNTAETYKTQFYLGKKFLPPFPNRATLVKTLSMV